MGRHSLPDPEDSVDEPHESGEADDHHRDAVTEDYSDEGHYPPDEDFPAGADDFSAEDDTYTDEDFPAGNADEYPEFPPRQPGPSSSEPPAASPSLFSRGHRGLGDRRGWR
ncbi:hypothetical protein WU83_12580, partial [Mycobacterium nebraskense]